MKQQEEGKKPFLRFYADAVYKKAVVKDYVKEYCERILYLVKVTKKIIYKFLWLVCFTTLVSLATAG